MEEWGNGRANAYYEANVPAHVVKPKDGDSVRTVEKYIRDKYEHKRFIAKVIPPRIEREVVEEEAPEPVARRTSTTSKAPVKQVRVPAAAPAPVVAAPEPSLIDFMDDPVAPPAAPAAAANVFDFGAPAGSNGQQFQQQQQQQQNFGFSAFEESPRQQTQGNTSSNVSLTISGLFIL